MFRFQKLDSWQKAIEFVDVVYKATASFRSDERFGLTSQLRRAAVSVSSNIAEGSSRSSNTEFSRFIEIAYGSLMEVVSQVHVAQRPGFLDEATFDDVCLRADEIARMLSELRSSLKRQQR